ncbi:MAG TPA: protein kinase [Polyangiaceae bacterium]|nr:protein kinase [Polyangiaceae bacterium]
MSILFESGARIRHYEILRELGRGGMGVVYLARDTRLGRRVAIKVLLTRSSGSTEDFLREARATASCSHDNIVVIHEVDEHEGTPYMVLEHLDGANLRQFVRGRKLSPNRAIELIVPVVRALVRAHDLGIVHRDLKPENVFVTTSGTVKVLDFGIAALRAEDEGEKPLAGTVPYMAPEQFQPGGADHRSDLWATGIMLYELLAGHHPIDPLTPEQLLRHAYFVDEPYPRVNEALPDLPLRLAQAVDRCLEKQKERRVSTAAELLDLLEPLVVSHGPRALQEGASPYPGLSAFQESDADRFFGRGTDILHLIARLRDHPGAAVVGASGVGKSSFVRAGVVPALRASGESWEALILRPGREPLEGLATALLGLPTSRLPASQAAADHRDLVEKLRESPGEAGRLLRVHAAQHQRQVLLFVDQLEELYTLVPDELTRRAFTACLSGVADDAAAPLRLVVSLRSDFLDRVGEDRRFLDDLVRGLHFLQPLPPGALREALERPIAQLGYTFESDALLAEMVDSLAATAGALPLLQFAGTKLWEARDSRRKVLTAESYRQMGGISGVLAQHADQVVSALPLALRSSVRGVFQRLVTAEGTRAIVDLADLESVAADRGEARAVVEHLAQARLLVVQNKADESGAMVELVHESLISGWPMLRRWLDEGRDEAAFREQLRAAAKQWQARGKPQGLLWRGEAFEETRQWRARHSTRLPDREQEFLDAVIDVGTRAQRVRRQATLAAIGLLIAIVAAGAIALVQIRRAERAAINEAEIASREARRAREAEEQITQQLELIKQEQAAKAEAQTQVAQGKEDLQTANARLEKALSRAESESLIARTESKRAQDAADATEKTNARLAKLLADERARAEKLEKERRKIVSELR